MRSWLWASLIITTGCGIQIGGEEWGGGKACLQASPEPIGQTVVPHGWEEPVSNLLGQATLPATGTMRPPIVGASPNPWDGGGAVWAEKGVPMSFTLRAEPTELTRVRREPHLGEPQSACPDQVFVAALLSLRSELITVDTPVQLVFEPGVALISEALPPERGEVAERPRFVRDYRHDRTWLAVVAELGGGAWSGELAWHGESDGAGGSDPVVETEPVGVFEASVP